MKIDAGRMITEAMVKQREHDFLLLVVQDSIVGTWKRMSQTLTDKGWMPPMPEAHTIEEAIEQADVVQDHLTAGWPHQAFMGNGPIMPHDGGTIDLGLDDPDKPWRRPE